MIQTGILCIYWWKDWYKLSTL